MSNQSKDLVTKNLDLARAVVELVAGTNAKSLTTAGVEIIQWLARERIGKDEYIYCLDQTKGLAYPNEHGLAIRESIFRSESKLAKAGGIHIIRSGSLGRWMAFSGEHCWLVTTVAVLARYEDLEFMTSTLAQFVLASHPTNWQAHSLRRSRLRAVLRKICESIALHVINPGHSVGEIPAELSYLCPKHMCNMTDFADVIVKVQRSKKDLLISSTHFQGIILSWLLAHFEGSLEVSVCGAKVFSKSPEDASRHLIMVIEKRCPQDAICLPGQGRVAVYERFDDKYERVMFGCGDNKTWSSPIVRRPLYTGEGHHVVHLLGQHAKNKVEETAGVVISYVLNVGIKLNPGGTLEFQPLLGKVSDSAATEGRRVRDLIYRWPNQNFADSKFDSSVLDRKEVPQIQKLNKLQYADYSDPKIWKIFPPVAEMLSHASVQNQCTCPECAKQSSFEECRPGCLRSSAMAYFLLLVGHAIADAFGVDDVSGLIDLQEYTAAVKKILDQFVSGTLRWNAWFNLAASTALGYRASNFQDTKDVNLEANALIAAQNGSIAAVAPWADFSQKLFLNGCFRVEIVHGSFSGVLEEMTFLRTEPVTQLDKLASPPQSPQNIFDQVEASAMDVDESILEIQTYVMAAESCYRHVTIAKTERALRVVDPSFGLNCLASSPPIIHCTCDRSRSAPGAASSSFMGPFHSIDNILVNWDICPESPQTEPTTDGNTEILESDFTAAVLIPDTNEKYNIALAFNATGCAIVDSQSSCLRCIKEAFRGYPKENRRIVRTRLESQRLGY